MDRLACIHLQLRMLQLLPRTESLFISVNAESELFHPEDDCSTCLLSDAANLQELHLRVQHDHEDGVADAVDHATEWMSKLLTHIPFFVRFCISSEVSTAGVRQIYGDWRLADT